MASIAATATGLRMSDTMPSRCSVPCCCSTLAMPSAVASSHQRDRSVSMMMLGPVGRGALVVALALAGGRVVDADFDELDEHAPAASAASAVAATSLKVAMA